jgi:protein-tyrosine phosphatase
MQPALAAISAYLAHSYGGKRGFALAAWHALRAALGCLASYRRVEWMLVSRVIFVCKGNICRSAFAGRRFRCPGIEVISAGLEADIHKPADPRAAAAASRFGTDLAPHRSTPLHQVDLRAGDLLVAFEPDHAERLSDLAQGQTGVQVTLLGFWAIPPTLAYIHDPYGLSEAYVEACFERIDRGLAGLRQRLCAHRSALETGT